jgi:cob(I)alamin adenosyltransferase
MRIYTRTGDRGETGLFGGGRVPKDSARVEAYGAVDELNAAVGLAVVALETEDAGEIVERLRLVQADLFNLGANLAAPTDAEGRRRSSHIPALPAGRAAEMERWIDEAEEELPPLRSFILPGGTEGAARLHLARTVCRRAERRVVALSHREAIDPAILVYLNRLSDLLFTLARLANRRAGREDVEWTR